MNPLQKGLHPYPFERLASLKKGINPPESLEHIALSIGEPQHEPPTFVQDILASGLPFLRKYPATSGSLELKQCIQSWIKQRFKATLDTTQILPVNGSREALFALAQSHINPNIEEAQKSQAKCRVLMPNPFYQIYEGAAIMANAEPYYYSLDEAKDFEPDWASIPEDVWQDTQLVYTCSPGNPSGKILSEGCLKQLIDLSDKYNFLIASDECYSEIYDDSKTPPLGLLELCVNIGRTNFKNCIVFNSLSKRSNLPGLRSGFVAGDLDVVQAFLQYRTYHGSAMPLLTQQISIAAWQDEAHVKANRVEYDNKYKLVLDILKPAVELERPEAAFFIWLKVPGEYNDESFTQALFKETNITVLPGSYLARNNSKDKLNPGRNYVRIALVAEQDACVEAAHRIQKFISTHSN